MRATVKNTPEKVIRSFIKQKTNKVLSKAAALVRLEAKQSIKSVSLRQARKKSAPPGGAPQTIRERRSPLKTFLIYAQRSDGAYIVGTKRLPNITNPPVPGLHEHGGTKQVRVRMHNSRERQKRNLSEAEKRRLIAVIKRKNIRRKQRNTRLKTVTYPRRPFMVPALRKIQRKYRKLF